MRRNEDGFIYVVGRARDVIISGGENISAVEVEHAVAAHPEVADASVIGVPHPTRVETPAPVYNLGVVNRPHPTRVETPLAIVAPVDPGGPPTLQEILDFLSDRLASCKRPTGLEVVDELPRNASGEAAEAQAEAGVRAGSGMSLA